MEFYERVSGARMHAAFHKPANLFSYCLTKDILLDILKFVNSCFKTLNEMHNVLTYNKVWKQRLVNIGTLNINNVLNWNMTGVMARSVGIKKIYDYQLNITIRGIIQYLYVVLQALMVIVMIDIW